MNTFDWHQLQELLSPHLAPCVSLFLPIRRTGPEIRENDIRFKNQLRQAEESLISRGLRSSAAHSLLGPAASLANDGAFWDDRSDGLAVFCCQGFLRFYHLPIAFEERMVVGDKFLVMPLVPFLEDDTRFYVLALSQSSVRLFQASRQQVAEVELINTPASIDEVVPEMQTATLGFHTMPGFAGGQKQRGPAIFHGHGGPRENNKEELLTYCQRVNAGVSQELQGERGPLVLACVGYLAALYEEANTYPNLLHAKVPGNPEMWSPAELRDRAWQLVEPQLRKQREQRLADYWPAAAAKRACHELAEVAAAAERGQVEVLFLAEGTPPAPPSDDQAAPWNLLDDVAMNAVLYGGRVYVVPAAQMPNGAPYAAAILRYPLSVSKPDGK